MREAEGEDWGDDWEDDSIRELKQIFQVWYDFNFMSLHEPRPVSVYKDGAVLIQCLFLVFYLWWLKCWRGAFWFLSLIKNHPGPICHEWCLAGAAPQNGRDHWSAREKSERAHCYTGRLVLSTRSEKNGCIGHCSKRTKGNTINR